jgi:PHP family Zn ribbon phosphoesterase
MCYFFKYTQRMASDFLTTLPQWRLAGKRVSDTTADTSWIISNTVKEDGSHNRIEKGSATDQHKSAQHAYRIEKGYLIPEYPPETDTRQHRDEDLLEKRIKRFFYACEPRLDVEYTREQIDADIVTFDEAFERLNTQRANQKKEPFSLSLPYRSITNEERAILSDGAIIVGAAVNRLGRLGKIIIQGNRAGVKIEYDDDYIAQHMDAIEREFSALYTKLTDNTHESLVRCVLTRGRRVDHDRVLHHLIREINRPVMPHMKRAKEQMAKLTDDSTDAPIVAVARNNIVIEIGNCLEAIDEVNDAITPIYKSTKFATLINDVRAARRGDAPVVNPRTNDLNLKSFVPLIEEYVELSRARACLRSDDHDNFKPISARLRHLRDTLTVQQGTLFKYADSIGDIDLRTSIKLIARGLELVSEMAELRLPRNSRANGIYDQELEEFNGRDASSVGRFKEKVARDVERWKDNEIPATTVVDIRNREQAANIIAASRAGRTFI